MKTVNIHEAKTQLSKLIEEASKGDRFVIAKAGKPVVKVIALGAPTGPPVRRLGFMAGQISVPTISTGWARRRSSASSAVVHETSVGYASPPVGCR
jgi:prevent-host-death family protein